MHVGAGLVPHHEGVLILTLGEEREGEAAVPPWAQLVGEGLRARYWAGNRRGGQSEECLERIIHLYHAADICDGEDSLCDTVRLLVLNNVRMLLVDVQAPQA